MTGRTRRRSARAFPNWQPGDELLIRPGHTFRVLAIRAAHERDPEHGTLAVQPAWQLRGPDCFY